MAKIKKRYVFEEKIKSNKIKESRISNLVNLVTGEDWKVFLETCLVNSANRILITVRGWKRFQMQDQHGWKKKWAGDHFSFKGIYFCYFCFILKLHFEILMLGGNAQCWWTRKSRRVKKAQNLRAERETAEIGWKDREEINHRSKYQNKHIVRNKVPFITPPSLSRPLSPSLSLSRSNTHSQMRNWCNHSC